MPEESILERFIGIVSTSTAALLSRIARCLVRILLSIIIFLLTRISLLSRITCHLVQILLEHGTRHSEVRRLVANNKLSLSDIGIPPKFGSLPSYGMDALWTLAISADSARLEWSGTAHVFRAWQPKNCGTAQYVITIDFSIVTKWIIPLQIKFL